VDRADSEQRLSRITTHWYTLLRAHDGSAAPARSARNDLILRYSGAVYRYLLGAVRDPEVAEELAQEFAVRFLRGDFRRVAPERGQFRNYLRCALANLVNDHHRARLAGPRPLSADAAEPPAPQPPTDEEFAGRWRTELLEQTWAALKEANPTHHAVLRLRVENPDMPSAEIAARVTGSIGHPMTPENVRKTLQRAHARFAELLVEQVAASLASPTAVELEDELTALDLLRYCRSALEKRRSGEAT
jgi:RNA polymerase sigma-70 factor (ECF subfamily)